MYYLADLESLEEKDKKLHLNDYYIFNNGFSKEECLNIIKENRIYNTTIVNKSQPVLLP